MKRRDFIKFMGASSATVAASTALCKIPEAKNKIILLDKPKDIIISKIIPDVDFIITEGIISIEYNDTRILPSSFLGTEASNNLIVIELEAWALPNTKLMEVDNFNTFSFDVNFTNNNIYQKYENLNSLNGRKFQVSYHKVNMSVDTFANIQIKAMEIL